LSTKKAFLFPTGRLFCFTVFTHPIFKNIEFMATIRLGDIAPDFTAETTQGTIHFHEWLGDGWGLLFSHPADFTPVCTTELGRTAALKGEFDKRGVKAIALSVDPIESHFDWLKDIEETQHVTMNFPIIADPDRKVAELYDMIHPNASEKFTVRTVFVIGPDKKVKMTLTYPASTGRNFLEILRVIDSLQLTANYSVATPAEWKNGEDVVIAPAIKDEDIPAKFPKGHKRIKYYLRMTPQPNL
jgi:alkyl hydroperoxide reductase subunit AhpC